MDLIENYPRYEHLLASAQLALAMLGMGALLAPRDFGRVARSPRALGVGLPLVAMALGRAAAARDGARRGLRARRLRARGHDVEPGDVSRAGMVVGASVPSRRQVFSRWCIRGSLFAIGLMIVGAGGSGRLDPRLYGTFGLVAIFALPFAFQATAWVASRAASLRSGDRLAVVVEATVRNTNLAILVKASILPAVAGRVDPLGDGMLFAALLYGGGALLAAVAPVLWHRRRGDPWKGDASG